MRDVIVVGGGIFGSVIARQFRSQGRDVLVVDNREPEAGSKPAACLIKPSWLGSMGDRVTPSLDLLDRLYGLQTVDFVTEPMGVKAPCKWVNPAHILDSPDHVFGDVRLVVGTANGWQVRFASEGEMHVADCRKLIVAAGVWTGKILSYRPLVEKTQAQAGRAFLFPGQIIDQPYINVWAPYKQMVGFNRGDGAWVGDGAAILQKNWEGAAEKNRDRVLLSAEKHHLVPDQETRGLFGLRPYVKDAKPLYMEELSAGLWAVTGGAKNGTIAAAWAAHYLGENA